MNLPMRRSPIAVLLFVLAVALSGALPAQITRDQFRAEFSKGLELGDQRMMDSVMKKDRAAPFALLYFEELYAEKMGGHEELAAKCEALKTSWERCFEKSPTLDKMQRWLDGMQTTTYSSLQKGRNSSAKLWEFLSSLASPTKEERLKVMRDFVTLAENARALGHMGEVAEIYGLASVVGNQVPDRTIDERKEVLECTKQFLEARKAWEFTFDTYFIMNTEWVKSETAKIAEAEKKGDKRKAEGYDPNAKGVDSLIVPGAKDDVHALQYEALSSWDNDLDYGPKGGPLPPLWWNAPVGKEGTARKLDWFRRREIHLARLGSNKFGISFDGIDLKKTFEVEVSNKAKPSTFWLDADKKVPYSMFFWVGSDKERVGEAECNLMPTGEFANVYYRSAASWKTSVGTENSDVFEPPYKVAVLGDATGDGTSVPLLDSMRLGKGPRMPFSEFVKLSGGWFHLRRVQETVALRPLNPEYFKTGKVKLVWNHKPSAPVQLVLQGAGDYKTAFFDVAGGKEVEVPAGQYSVVFGRILVGKGARTQNATIFQGDSKPFSVEAGKTFELKMGAPFVMNFDRKGDENPTIDATKILLHEASGCVLTDLFGIGLAPEVMAAKAEDGKGAKVIGKFGHFNDAELLNKAAAFYGKLGQLCAAYPMPDGYKSGEMVLKVKLPAAGMKVGLSMKKHPLFGVINSTWQ
jgi:hypothetical protein